MSSIINISEKANTSNDLPLTRHTVPVYSDCFGQNRNILYSPVDHLRRVSRRRLWYSGHIDAQWQPAKAKHNTLLPMCSHYYTHI